MSRADLLNLPNIATKLAKLQTQHTDHEALMDKWHNESAHNAEDEVHHEKDAQPRNPRRRKPKNLQAKARRGAPKESGGNGAVYEAGGETDAAGELPEKAEKLTDGQ